MYLSLRRKYLLESVLFFADDLFFFDPLYLDAWVTRGSAVEFNRVSLLYWLRLHSSYESSGFCKNRSSIECSMQWSIQCNGRDIQRKKPKKSRNKIRTTKVSLNASELNLRESGQSRKMCSTCTDSFNRLLEFFTNSSIKRVISKRGLLEKVRHSSQHVLKGISNSFVLMLIVIHSLSCQCHDGHFNTESSSRISGSSEETRRVDDFTIRISRFSVWYQDIRISEISLPEHNGDSLAKYTGQAMSHERVNMTKNLLPYSCDHFICFCSTFVGFACDLLLYWRLLWDHGCTIHAPAKLRLKY